MACADVLDMGSPDVGDGSAKYESSQLMKLLHTMLFGCWSMIHFGLARYHCMNMSGAWSYFMVTNEISSTVMQLVGFRKAGLLLSIGEMSGGHYQHLFTNGMPVWEGLLSTWPTMNMYIILAILSYLTAPASRPAHKPSLKKVFYAIFGGVIATRTFMWTIEYLSSELVVLISVLYIFVPEFASAQRTFAAFFAE